MSNQQNDEYEEMIAEAKAEVDPKEVQEVMEEPITNTEIAKKEMETPILPEAPASITVKGYYKGFSVMITKRNAEGKAEIDKITIAIENMIAKGFKPSWNEDTNGKTLTHKSYAEKEVEQTNQETCLHKIFTIKKSTGHNNPANAGKMYKACIDCNKFISWYTPEPEGQGEV